MNRRVCMLYVQCVMMLPCEAIWNHKSWHLQGQWKICLSDLFNEAYRHLLSMKTTKCRRCFEPWFCRNERYLKQRCGSRSIKSDPMWHALNNFRPGIVQVATSVRFNNWMYGSNWTMSYVLVRNILNGITFIGQHSHNQMSTLTSQFVRT